MTMVATATATQTSDTAGQKREWLACSDSPLHFTHRYASIYDAVEKDWIAFRLWPAQARTLKVFQTERQVVVLKARQIGMTWLALAYALWLMLFHPAATVLLFSRRDDEAIELLERLKGMYRRLPAWMKARAVAVDNAHEWGLSNGSRAMAFPTSAGDSYTATLVIADEFDLVVDQDRLMAAVKPTIDNGGQMILLSRPDKSTPNSRFKQIYRTARSGVVSGWWPVFLPWHVHPRRTARWYAQIRDDILHATGSLDEVHEQYPATDAEALAPRTLDKRIAPAWLAQCYIEQAPLCVVGEFGDVPDGAPAIPGLTLYRLPEAGKHYVQGADPAEGLPSSDDSAVVVLDADTGEEVALLAGKFEPKSVFPGYIMAVGDYYNRAPVLVERNNHGHAVIGYLENQATIPVLPGFDNRPGWHNTPAGKVRLYDNGAAAFMAGEACVHSFTAMTQLQSIEKSTLRAPEGEHDDLADAFVLAVQAQAIPTGVSMDFV